MQPHSQPLPPTQGLAAWAGGQPWYSPAGIRLWEKSCAREPWEALSESPLALFMHLSCSCCPWSWPKPCWRYSCAWPSSWPADLASDLPRHRGLAWAVTNPGYHHRTCPALLVRARWDCPLAGEDTAWTPRCHLGSWLAFPGEQPALVASWEDEPLAPARTLLLAAGVTERAYAVSFEKQRWRNVLYRTILV